MIGAAMSFVFGGSASRTVVTLLIGVAMGATAGWQVQGWRSGYNATRAVQQQAAHTLRQIDNQHRASATHQREQDHADQTHTQIRERVRVINARPGAAGQCLDADGLQQLGAAIDNGAPPAAGPGRPMPATGPAD